MDAFKGVTFQDWACAATHMGAGMTEQGVCEVLGLTLEDWQEANSYWLSNLQAMLTSNPDVMAAYMSYCQNPKQGKFAAVQGGPRPLEALLQIVPDYPTYAQINQQYMEASEVEGANMIEFFKGFGLTMVEWGEVAKYWAPQFQGYEPPVSKTTSSQEGEPTASQTSSGTQEPAPTVRKSSNAITETNLEFFTKTGPGVFVLKQPVFLPALIMAGCLLAAVGLAIWAVFAHDNSFLIGTAIFLVYFGKTLYEILIKTVFDQNNRTITGLLTAILFIKLKSTVSFDDFEGFYHVTKQSRSATGVGITTETRLDMRFVADGTTKNVTLLKVPSKEKMDRVCSEILSLMKGH